jgi:hypothetical protein
MEQFFDIYYQRLFDVRDVAKNSSIPYVNSHIKKIVKTLGFTEKTGEFLYNKDKNLYIKIKQDKNSPRHPLVIEIAIDIIITQKFKKMELYDFIVQYFPTKLIKTVEIIKKNFLDKTNSTKF